MTTFVAAASEGDTVNRKRANKQVLIAGCAVAALAVGGCTDRFGRSNPAGGAIVGGLLGAGVGALGSEAIGRKGYGGYGSRGYYRSPYNRDGYPRTGQGFGW